MKMNCRKMNNASKWMKVVVCALMFLILFAECGGAAAAAQQTLMSTLPQTDKNGSIQITMKDAGKTVSGGTFTCINVGILETEQGESVWKFANTFTDCGLNMEQLQTEEFADKLWKYAQEKSAYGTTKEINKSGTVLFENIPVGVYLMVQQKAADGYYEVHPFVVTIPVQDENGWRYDVDASPKMEKMKKKPVTPEKKQEDSQKQNSRKLPQTGQLNWPIPVLTFLGVILFTIGWRLYRKGKES